MNAQFVEQSRVFLSGVLVTVGLAVEISVKDRTSNLGLLKQTVDVSTQMHADTCLDDTSKNLGVLNKF